MPLPIVGGVFAWFVGLATSSFTAFTTFLIGRMVYEKAVKYALITAFLVAAAGLTASISLLIKALIIGARVAMPPSMAMVTYFLPANINQMIALIVTIRVSVVLYRWTISTMAAYVPSKYPGRPVRLLIMTDFAVTGKKRTGKGLFCAGLIRDKLLKGCRVATNMDIFTDHMFGPTNKSTLIRLPDCPTVGDLQALGRGYEGEYDDDRNGIIVLDEASKYFNSRQFGDKERQPMLDYLIHSGKLGWDVYYQMQGLVQVDKQIRDTQIEYHVSVKNTNRWPIPFVTPVLGLIGIDVRFPKMHLGIYRHGCDRDSMVVQRKFYKAVDLYKAYDTRQVFLDRAHPDAVGLHSVLSAWHIKGRHLRYVPSMPVRFLYGVLGIDWTTEKYQGGVKPKSELKPKLQLVHSLSKLPPDQAVRHWKRLDRLGAFECAA